LDTNETCQRRGFNDCSTAYQLKQDILNKGFFIMPLGDDLYKVGATYEWERLNDIPTEKGKDELLKKLNSVFNVALQNNLS
jgi:hypothetical protein